MSTKPTEDALSHEPQMRQTLQAHHSCLLSDVDLLALETEDGLHLIEPTEQELRPGDTNPNSGTYLLRIGRIFLGRAELNAGDIDAATSSTGVRDCWLDSGDVAIVETLETVRLPHKYLGIVFGTNSLTSKGLLLLNPGFITAGHHSTIRFFVVNFGRQKCNLRAENTVARLLVLQFPSDNHPGDRIRDHQDDGESMQDNLYKNIARLMGERIEEGVRDAQELRISEFNTTLQQFHTKLQEQHKNMLDAVNRRIWNGVILAGVVAATMAALIAIVVKVTTS